MKRLLLWIIFLFLHSTVFADESIFQALKYRNLGPTRGGRSSAVTGIPDQPNTFFMGVGGGLWKTVNAGQSWENISDSTPFKSSSIGAIAVADSDSNVIYVGTGQATIRGNVALGLGIYKSTDAGRTWSHSGLDKVGQIAKIRIDPRDPMVVYVAAVGNPFVPNDERGVFRSDDGGKNWKKILYISPKTGVVDLAMEPGNPRILYAAAWTGQRKPWTIVSGSEESGLYKSVDGGDTWKKLANGLPEGVVGKIGIAISPANPNRIWALVEAEKGGLFRSDDGGASFKLLETNQKRRLWQRAWYYMHIFADPVDQQKVYILNVDEFRSRDGGSTFDVIDVPHGDGHDLWINPNDTRIMIMATDGGASVSLDEGAHWSTLLNQPTAEIYNVAVDHGFPYRVYGAQQDNSTISIPSRNLGGLTPFQYWIDPNGGESGHIGFDYQNPEILYAGSYGGEINRTNLKTGEFRSVMVYPQLEVGLAAQDLRYRFNWNAPLRVSRHNPKEIFYASQYIHRSMDEGQTWEIISPDLSRNDKSKLGYSGEPITYENTGVEVYSNVLTFEESPLKAGVYWAGSDDGLIHVSEDDGKNWRNVTPPGIPQFAIIQSIEPSPHDVARAYAAIHNYFFGDRHPYLYRTDDFGKHWTLLTNGKNGIPEDDPTRAIREDPVMKGLLYAATENGIYVSFDNGGKWQSMQSNLPIIPVTDLRIEQDDLVVSTQGRSFWILDDLTAIRQIAAGAVAGGKPALLKPRDTYRMRMPKSEDNPPNGAMIFYYLPTEEKKEVTLRITDSKGNLVNQYSSEKNALPASEFPYDVMGSYTGDRKLTKTKGLNRFVWDLRYPVVDFPKGTIVWGFVGGPRVSPGTYKATLQIGDWTQDQTFQVLKDPRTTATQADFDEQIAFQLHVRDRLNELYKGVVDLRQTKEQMDFAVTQLERSGKDVTTLKTQAGQIQAKLRSVEDELLQWRNEADQDTENFPTKLDNQLAYVYWQMDLTDGRPTAAQRERVADLEKDIATQLGKLKTILNDDIAQFNKAATDLGAKPVM